MNLLIAENPMMVLPTLAERVGVEEAVFVQQIHFLNLHSKNVKDGHRWVYNTYEEWLEIFKFFRNADKIKRIVNRLEKLGLLVTTTKYNSLKIDRRKWYRVNYESELLVFEPQTALQAEDGQKANMPDEKANLPEQYTETYNKDLQQINSFVVGGDAGSLKTADGAAEQTPEPAADIADESALVGADAPTHKPKSGLAEDKKRFEALAQLFNRVFENCPAVAKVSLATVPDPKTGRQRYTQTNLKRLKLVPYAWALARQRVESWQDADGLIDGEAPNGRHVLQWFKLYFEHCLQDGFINGSQPRNAEHAGWKAGFDYLLRADVLEKRVFEE